jgi:UDP-GlcNAc:undecaprenyl-phosphate/decaprenyl-phosphate GlcNAc-1-phosphate transferase
MTLTLYFLGFVLSFVFALSFTPLMRNAAIQLGIVDKPDGNLKTHDRTIAYLGGLAVYAAFLMTVGVLADFKFSSGVIQLDGETLGLLLAGCIALLVGLIDDFGALTPSQKMLGQLFAALVLVKSGTYIKLAFLPVWVAIPLTLFWILAVTNAFNIIDIMDGLASGVAAVAAVSIAAANHLAGRSPQAFLAVVLAGAAIGFLRHNFHPARIFLGDAGSMFVGFMLAALSMNAGYTRVNLLATVSPIFILGIPLFDLLLVMFIRWQKGIPMTKGSPDHFALRLRRCNLSVRETTITTYVIGILLGVAALLMSNIRLEWAIVTMGSTMSLGCLSAYLLMKVNMRS